MKPLEIIKSSKLSSKTSRHQDPIEATVVISYIRNLSEAIRRILTPLNVRTTFKPHLTFRQILVHPKTKIEDDQKNGVVYEIPCGSCNQVYIGQTGRTLEHRLKEHMRALTAADFFYNTSAVADHAIKNSHSIAWTQARVIDMQNNLRQRCLLESWHIRKEGQTAMNRENGILPEVYSTIV